METESGVPPSFLLPTHSSRTSALARISLPLGRPAAPLGRVFVVEISINSAPPSPSAWFVCFYFGLFSSLPPSLVPSPHPSSPPLALLAPTPHMMIPSRQLRTDLPISSSNYFYLFSLSLSLSKSPSTRRAEIAFPHMGVKGKYTDALS